MSLLSDFKNRIPAVACPAGADHACEPLSYPQTQHAGTPRAEWQKASGSMSGRRQVRTNVPTPPFRAGIALRMRSRRGGRGA
ncbi:hypothetical protein GCM10010987_48780 [Bradyrhizobium guangdongense]|uniref:Uncharacterized protein n=1 Tax=Bradyrhizobium guangdongense TaxID=1325090 RepID=A0AA88BA40_9BRAD|nr:hypothetical protein GCM10010987_48780 [Bradyrhizobium guangdongense]